MNSKEWLFYGVTNDTLSSWHSTTMNFFKSKKTLLSSSMAWLLKTKKEKEKEKIKIIVKIENLLEVLTVVAENDFNTRLQVIFYFDLDSHALAIDFFYDIASRKFKIVCFDSSKVVQQYELLKQIVYFLNQQKYDFHIIACQGGIQKDAINCSLFAFLALHEFAKENIYQVLLEHNSWITIPSFQISPRKVQSQPSLEKVQWISTQNLPTKIILCEQSFTEMETNLKVVNATQIIDSHKAHYNLYGKNTYIDVKRIRFGKKILADGNQRYSFEIKLQSLTKHDRASPELSDYFTLMYAEKVISYLNDFILKVNNYFDLFKEPNTWYLASLENERISTRLIFNTSSSCIASKICQFLSGFNIANSYFSRNEILFYFTDKTSEVIFYNEQVKKSNSLFTHFQNEYVCKQTLPDAIANWCSEMLLNQEHTFLLKLFDYAIQVKNDDYIKNIADLINQFCHLKFAEDNGWLHLAVLLDTKYAFRYMIEKNFHLTDHNSQHLTPIHLAVKEKRFELIKYVVENHIDISIKNSNNQLPIHYIDYPNLKYNMTEFNFFKLIFNHTKITKELLQQLMCLAIEHTTIQQVDFLLKPRPNSPISIALNEPHPTFNHGTYLHYAALENNEFMFKYLISKGLDPHLKNNNGETALVLFKEKDVIRYLEKELLSAQGEVYGNSSP